MRILHTSDWHLGQNFYGKSRKREHQAFISWLLQQVAQLQVNAVVVAGDIFDTGTPPSYARELYNQFVVEMHHLGVPLVILGGNHDSVAMLNESSQLVARLGTHVVTSSAGELEQQLIELNGPDGEIAALLCAVPFLRARDLVESRSGESGIEKRRALSDAIKQHYATLHRLAEQRRDQLGRNIPIISSGHLAALGVSQSDSVRDIYIGSMEGFDAAGFPAADYIALGHIHRPQRVAGSEQIRYSGSPLPLSFDELNSEKQLLLVEFDDGKFAGVEPITVPRFQAMQMMRGTLSEIETQLAAVADEQHGLWLSVEVEVDDLLVDLQQQLQQMTQELNVEVLQLKRARNRNGLALQQQAQEALSELSPREVFERRLALEPVDDEAQQQRAQRVTERFEQVLAQLQTEAPV